MAHMIALTLQVEMSTSLTRHLSIALDFASLAFITDSPQRSSASCHMCLISPRFMCRERIPCNGDIAVPLGACVCSVGLVGFPLGIVGVCRRVLLSGICLRV